MGFPFTLAIKVVGGHGLTPSDFASVSRIAFHAGRTFAGTIKQSSRAELMLCSRFINSAISRSSWWAKSARTTLVGIAFPRRSPSCSSASVRGVGVISYFQSLRVKPNASARCVAVACQMNLVPSSARYFSNRIQ